MRSLVSAVALALVLTACGGGGGEDEASGPRPEVTSTTEADPVSSEPITEEPTDTPEPSVEPNATYGSVTDLRDAMVELGYPCPKWKQDNVLTFASSSGHCSAVDVFSVYVDAADLKSQMGALRDFGAFDEFGSPMLAGPNWLVNVEDVEAYRTGLGGTVIAN